MLSFCDCSFVCLFVRVGEGGAHVLRIPLCVHFFTQTRKKKVERVNLTLERIHNVPKRGPEKLWLEPCTSWQFMTKQIKDISACAGIQTFSLSVEKYFTTSAA